MMLRGLARASVVRRFRAMCLRQKIASRVGNVTANHSASTSDSHGREGTRSLDQGGGAAPGDQWHQFNSASPTAHFGGAGNFVFAVVAALHQHVRTQRFNQMQWRALIEEHDRIHHLQRSENPGTVLLANQRTLEAP